MTFSIKPTGPNGDEIEFWNGPQGQNWVTQNDLTDLMYDPFGAQALARAELSPGEHVIDIGCGCGKTTGALAERVIPGGRVAALDVSVPMLEIAKRRTSPDLDFVEFVSADAADYNFDQGSYDVLFSQFGLMFFHNMEAAFSNFFGALKPNGRTAFVCWRRPDLNPWLMIPFHAVRRFVPDMPVPSPDVPSSPFSLARQDRLHDLLVGAGFEDVQLEEFRAPTRMGRGDLDECLRFVADFSNPVATALRLSEASEAPKILDAVRDAVAPYHNGNTLELPAASWIVSARRR
ncbi:methyltransferase domain-containing protein [Alisedimentitalea sp. MJ-SS2]|uniref:class I SAM-dependent methyltransferase n=1 Tax=Aliisedimentitalea sp. MJ-SS2 TaxID=3049795 RepID=UPI00290A7C18|nr:methyltransferase domain-containing protein [Alisedimentitalea sp. MJ-SS2]MDU8927416.1 methyltransferase domain-containing protein [Alisedimentitalea sp. MJ-SS2]